MRIASILLIGTLLGGRAAAGAAPVEREIFPPAHGKGAIVVVISGQSDPAPYRDFSSKLAKNGYYTVLIKAFDVLPGFGILVPQGSANLRAVIADAQSAPKAIPGKVALVGLSLGGAAALVHGGSLKDRVSAIVAFYPALTMIAPQDDMKSLAASLQVPVLVMAGEKDDENGCCMINTVRELDAAPKAGSLDLVVYPNAGHGFNLHDPRFVYREKDAADAWARTLAFLRRLQPPRGG
jgi:pimeloyl-ACP methyl ester carboxylesterase